MLKLIVLILIGVLALSFFGITIQSIVTSPAGQANFSYMGHILTLGWDYFLAQIQLGATWLQQKVSGI